MKIRILLITILSTWTDATIHSKNIPRHVDSEKRESSVYNPIKYFQLILNYHEERRLKLFGFYRQRKNNERQSSTQLSPLKTIREKITTIPKAPRRKFSLKTRGKAKQATAYVSYLRERVGHLKDATNVAKEKNREAMVTMKELRNNMSGIKNILNVLLRMTGIKNSTKFVLKKKSDRKRFSSMKKKL